MNLGGLYTFRLYLSTLPFVSSLNFTTISARCYPIHKTVSLRWTPKCTYRFTYHRAAREARYFVILCSYVPYYFYSLFYTSYFFMRFTSHISNTPHIYTHIFKFRVMYLLSIVGGACSLFFAVRTS